MQICHVRDSKESLNHSFEDIFLQHTTSASHAG
jgi:hypothetical protein